MREFDLSSLMKSLYQNMNYFVQIPPDCDATFEESYHESTTDPDGLLRQLLEEREHSLAGIKEITDHLRDKVVPGKILDVGCGLGWLLSSLDNKWDKHGIEISKFASSHASKFGNIHNGTLDDFDEKLKFDVIVMNHVIEHLENPVGALQKIYKLLKPGGTFIIGTPNFDSAAARRYGSNFRLLHDPTHISLFSSDSMHRCLRDQNFKINYVDYG